jgi:hypothetical protein
MGFLPATNIRPPLDERSMSSPNIRWLGRKSTMSILRFRACFSASLELMVNLFSDFEVVGLEVDFVEELYDISE